MKKILVLLSLLLSCGRTEAIPEDLPLMLRVHMMTSNRLLELQSKERIQFQVEFLRILRDRGMDTVHRHILLGDAPTRCTGPVDRSWFNCLDNFDRTSLRLEDRTMDPVDPAPLAPGCRQMVQNCHNMTFVMKDRGGNTAGLHLTHVCRYRGKYWIFGGIDCLRRQSDSNR